MRQAPKTIAVVVTGSVAAVKTFLLEDCLRGLGFDPRFIVTKAAWSFLKTEGKYAATPQRLAEFRAQAISSDDDTGAGKILDQCQAVLIAPASADFIRQVALGNTPIGHAIKNCQSPVFIAPAMNVMMWSHPAVQGNVQRALTSGMTILGPDSGDMACGDHGSGRMSEPMKIAEAVDGFLRKSDFGTTRQMPQLLRSISTKSCKKILWIAGRDDGDESYEEMKALLRAGYDIQCVTSPEAANSAMLAALTGHPVISDHYQLYPQDGMEHIWLAEDADVVVMYPASRAYVEEMAQGAAASFIGCIYLASKRPVIVVPDADCVPSDIDALRRYGTVITEEKDIAHVLSTFVAPLNEKRSSSLLKNSKTYKKPPLPLAGEGGGRGCFLLKHSISTSLSFISCVIDTLSLTLSRKRERGQNRVFQQTASVFLGKKFLVLGGHARERVDSFRFYTNTARPQDQGAKVADALRVRGATVTLISAEKDAADLVDQCRALKDQSFDTVIQLAGIAQFTCPEPVLHKISKNGDDRARLFQVTGTVDVLAELQNIFGAEKVMGYDRFQEWHGNDAQPLVRKIKSLARRSAQQSRASCRTCSGIHAGDAAKEKSLRVIITTGRTEEKLTQDGTVVTNGFTGQQGFEIAKAFAQKGADVVLVSGLTTVLEYFSFNRDRFSLPLPPTHKSARGERGFFERNETRNALVESELSIRVVSVVSMREMRDAVMREMETPVDIFIGVAAVADFSVPEPLPLRLKAGESAMLPMQENPSIVAAVARHADRPKIVVSFAAQSPDTVLEYAVKKFEALGVDMTVANPIGAGAAMAQDSTRNQVTIITRSNGEIVTKKIEETTKAHIAQTIAELALSMNL